MTVLLVAAAGVACASADSEDAPEGRIAFRIELDGAHRLATVNADGSGDLTVLRYPRDFPISAPTWSPDGEKLAAGDDKRLWVVNADGTRLRRVAAGFYNSFAWAPDGRQIAFLQGSALYVEDADGTNRRRIARCDCAPMRLAWSPDGRFIAYVEWTEPDLEASTLIHLVHPDGTGKRVLTEGGQGGPPELSWSPNGKQIVFTRPPDVTERPGIYVIGRDSSGERRIASGEGPVWSTTGTRIAFTQNESVFTINSDGSGERRLGVGFRLSWSPTGTEIAVGRGSGDEGAAIWAWNADGSGGRQIWPREGVCECGAPTWLPD